jgi:predicted O-linked N-acetylglucosamine transferase (SPINDLY family)
METKPAEIFRNAVRLHSTGQFRAAQAAYLSIIETPELKADTASNLSALNLQLGDVAASERYARLAIATNVNHANGWNHLGLALKSRGAMAEAGQAFKRAAALNPGHAQAWANLAEVLSAAEDIPGSIAAYEKALAIEPELTIALVGYVHRKQQIASWDGLDEALARISRQIWKGEPAVDPFMMLFCCTDPREILKACQNAAQAREASVHDIWGTGLFPHSRTAKEKVRIGYISANYYDHAVGTLICQLLEAHDRQKFEVVCYCHSAIKEGARRERIKRAVTKFIEIDMMDDLAAAKLIHADGIDILVDLMGYTKGQRLRIFSLRPAPIQVTWIGFAGSAGGHTADYIIADRMVIPPGDDRFYDERPVRMPVCYQVNDSTRDVSHEPMTRTGLGLPENAIIFCNFNQTAKITPPAADLWAAILKAVPNSVLFLWQLYEVGANNMRREMAARGIAANRIHFGGTLAEPEHLTRYGLCDLFLDSFPYCGHATSSNALFGGCPLLALPGRTFASRVSASLLVALGLNELIAQSPEDYVRRAVALARNPARLKTLKDRLISARKTSPLFDGRRFAHDIERAYTIMIERYRRGEAANAIDL